MSQKFLLSIDGGGIRGIIPALALQKLEQITNRPARETFSFVAGTSTGALLASAIAAGMPASQIVEIYKHRIRDIFQPGKPWNNLREYTLGHKYDAVNLHKVLVEEFGPAATWELNQCPIDILLTAKGVADGKPWYFVRDNPANTGLTGKLNLIDCATASAAAPTYFDPWRLPAPVDGSVVDGGVGVAGNPVYQACVEAFYYNVDYYPEYTTVISFGTGRCAGEANPHLITGWLSWVVDALLHAPQEQQTELVARHFDEAVFYRLEPLLTSRIDMDDVARIGDLETAGKLFASQVDWEAMLRGDDTRFRVRHPRPVPKAA